MAVQTYTSITAEQRTFYILALIKRLLPMLPMFNEGQKRTVPTHQGGFQSTSISWRKWATLDLTTPQTPLTEGTVPSDTALSVSTVTSNLAQYGSWVKMSDLLIDASIDQVMTEVVQLLGEQAGQVLHKLIIGVLQAGTTVQYASTAVSRVTVAAGMILNSAEIREAVRTLRAANVPTYPDGYYHGLIHPFQLYDLQNDADWKLLQQYNGGGVGGSSMLNGEVGNFHGVKFITSTDAPKFAGAGAAGADVYGSLVYGPDWFGVLDFASQAVADINKENGTGMKINVVPADRQTKDDPLMQFGVAGWKCSFACKILDQLRGVRIETGATP